MMSGLIKQLCVLGIFFGAALSLAPEGGSKRIMELTCTAALVLTLALPLKSIDFDTYSLELAKYRDMEAQLAQNGGEASDRLNRLVIENEYETYILDKAKELGATALAVDVAVRWSLDGLWVPDSVTLDGICTTAQRQRLADIIETELGIPADSQEWGSDG